MSPSAVKEPKCCHHCKGKNLVKTLFNERHHIGHTNYHADVPVIQCVDCGETTMSATDLERFEAAVALALMDRRQSSAGFRFLRKKALIPAKDLARLLQVTPETISEWENKKVPPRAAWVVVGFLARERISGGDSVTRQRLEVMNAVEYPEVKVTLPIS